MREFNTAGPCDPTLHYTVMREALIAVGSEKVRKGRYFTLFAPSTLSSLFCLVNNMINLLILLNK